MSDKVKKGRFEMAKKLIAVLVGAVLVGVTVYFLFFFNYLSVSRYPFVDGQGSTAVVRYGSYASERSVFVYHSHPYNHYLWTYVDNSRVEIYLNNDGRVRSYCYYQRGDVGMDCTMCPAGEQCSWATETWTRYNEEFDLESYDR